MATSNSGNKIETIYIFIFLFAFVISLIALTTYSLFRPEYTHPKYNFSPFPTVAPVEVPDANLPGSGKCQNKLQTCDNILGCSMCGDCYECTPVGENEQVVFNGQKVPPGNWCLPKGKREVGCGTYTGRAVWADDPCSRKQGWKCVCLYPELFGGDDCLKQLACRDTSMDTVQTNNKLVSTDGKITWDPSDLNFDPQGTTPYDYDGDNPKFTCQCNQNKGVDGQVQYITMPNDPYRCHAEPCTPDHILKAFDQSTQQCECNKISANQFAHSNTTGQCLNMGNVCNWDDTNQQCICDESEPVVLCNSNNYSRPGKNDCPDMENPGGSYCKVGPCTSKGGLPYCNNLGTPSVVGDTCKCDCNADIGPNMQFVSQDNPRCTKFCIKAGTGITNWINGQCSAGGEPSGFDKYCCSGQVKCHEQEHSSGRGQSYWDHYYYCA